jgi:hypothetical protein
MAKLDRMNKETLLNQANDAYAALQQDSQQWLEYQEGLSLWDYTLEDGLKKEDILCTD